MFQNIFQKKQFDVSRYPYPDTNYLIEPVPYYIILAFIAWRKDILRRQAYLRFKTCINRNSADSGSKQYHYISQKD